MGATAFHPEDVKAALRKRYGTVVAFQRAKGLKGQQVRDLLRGKSSVAREAVAIELGMRPDHLVISSGEVPVAGTNSNKGRKAHRLNAGAK